MKKKYTYAELAVKLLLGEIVFHSNGQLKYKLTREDGYTIEKYWDENGNLVKELIDGNIKFLMTNPPYNTTPKNLQI